jgi:uncharacterized membrane protein (UPF0127 family)
MFLQRYLAFSRIAKPLIFFGLLLLGYVIFSSQIDAPNISKLPHQHRNEIILVSPWGQELETQISSTSHARQIGLSKHTSLTENQAMLFVFDQEGKYTFWMKNMDFAIDIFWLNSSQEIVGIKKNADPSDYPESYAPEADAAYVIETQAGIADTYNISLGQKFKWENEKQKTTQ